MWVDKILKHVIYNASLVCIMREGKTIFLLISLSFVLILSNCVTARDPCDGVTCSDHGHCKVDYEKQPMCICEKGYTDHWKKYCIPVQDPFACEDNGWCSPDLVLGNYSFNTIWCETNNNIWFAGTPGVMYHWDGRTLMEFPIGTDANIYGISGTGWADAKAVGWSPGKEKYQIIRWNGEEWFLEIDGMSDKIRNIWGFTENNYWAVGEKASRTYYYISHWDGEEWKEVKIGVNEFIAPLLGIWGIAPDNLWVYGYSYNLFNWDGKSWTEYSLGCSDGCGFYSAWGEENKGIWLVGDTYIWDGNDGKYNATVISIEGENIHEYNVGYGRLRDIDGFNSGDIYAVGSDGFIIHWDGTTWSVVVTGVTSNLNGICTVKNNIWIVGGQGTILHREIR